MSINEYLEIRVDEDDITTGPMHTHGTSDTPYGVPKGTEEVPGPNMLGGNLKRRLSTSPTPANTPTWPHSSSQRFPDQLQLDSIHSSLSGSHLHSHRGEFTDPHQDAATYLWEKSLRS